MDPNAMWLSLGEWQLWAVIAMAFALGAAGGLIHGLSSISSPLPKTTTIPAVEKQLWWRPLLVGGIASVAVLYLTNPWSGTSLVGGALAAGYAGEAVLSGVAARVEAVVARRESADRMKDLHEMITATDMLKIESRGETAAETAAQRRIASIRAKYGRSVP